jgi:uncharacterized protein (TIGR02118 family)
MKIVALVYRKAGISEKQFRTHWVEKHGPLMVRIVPGMVHYTQNVPIDKPGLGDDADGISELWFDDIDALKDYLDWRETPEARELRVDEDLFEDVPRTRRYVVEEYVFKQPPSSTLPG